MNCTIRPALADDAAEIGAVILRVLRETNAKDYTDEIIARIEHNLGPDAVRARSIVMERLLDDTPQGR